MQTGVRRAALPVIVMLIALAGCRGGGTIHVVPLGGKSLSTDKPLIVRVEPDECYYWINDENELCIAMRHRKSSLFGRRFSRAFNLSLVLDEPPAGSARQYRVRRKAMRSRFAAGFEQTRSGSYAGLVGVWGYGTGKLNGRFRLTIKRQSYSVLVGWSANTTALMVGEFTAVPDRTAGEAIMAVTEEGGLARSEVAPKEKEKKESAPAEPMGKAEP